MDQNALPSTAMTCILVRIIDRSEWCPKRAPPPLDSHFPLKPQLHLIRLIIYPECNVTFPWNYSKMIRKDGEQRNITTFWTSYKFNTKFSLLFLRIGIHNIQYTTLAIIQGHYNTAEWLKNVYKESFSTTVRFEQHKFQQISSQIPLGKSFSSLAIKSHLVHWSSITLILSDHAVLWPA